MAFICATRVVGAVLNIKIFPILVIGTAFFAAGQVNTEPVSAAACGSEPATTTGKSSQTITVPTTGTYTIWSRLKAPSTSPVEYKVYVSGQCFTVGQQALTANTLTWVDYENGTTADKATVTLSAGTHTMVLTAGTEDLELDRVMLLSDSCTPTGTGDNCLNDTTLPTTSITSPTAGATVSGTTPIQANASDNDAIDYVEFYRGGSTLLGTDNTAPYIYSWDTTSVADGAQSLTVKTYDISGNVRTSAAVSVTVNNSPPVNANISSFTATPSTITTGQSSSLAWSVSAGTGCTISNGVGAVALTGSQSVSPTTTTTYTLSCNGQNGGTSDSATTTVTVNPAPVNANISSFTATPSTITTGQSSSLAWSVSAGANCSIDQSVGAVSASGNQAISPTATTMYTLTCDGLNGGTGATSTATVTVNDASVDASISSFTATPSTITTGQSSSLAWSVSAGTGCTINQTIGAVSASGTQSVSPTATTTYTLTCQGLNGGASDSAIASVTVNPAPVNANISSFTATPSTITTGQSSSLAWSVSAGTSCTISNGVGAVALTGSQSVSPTATTTYTLSCNGQNGGSSDSVQVSVTVSSAPVADSDGDGIDDQIENAAPNGGDANGDSVADAQQADVVSLMNVTNSQYNTIVTNGGCNVVDNTSSIEGLTTHIHGAWLFTVTCSTPGQSSQVEILLDKKYDTTRWSVAKVNAALTESSDITSQVTIADKVLGSRTVTSLAYTAVDGGALDEDGAVNGTIVDPIAVLAASDTAPAAPADTLSNTGDSVYAYIAIAVAALVGSAVLITKMLMPTKASSNTRL